MEQGDWRNSVLTSPLMKIMADNLNRSASEMNPETSPLYRAVISHMDADRTAIDIGSGVGRFAIPLALAGVKVTAVEPSDEMRRHLLASIEKEGLSSSINVIPSLWPVQQDLHAEVSFASFVIQFSRDPIEFVRAMERSTSRRCVLSVHVDQPIGFLKDVWQAFRPSETAPTMLTFSDLYPMLMKEGIMADVTIIREDRPSRTMMDPDKMINLLADLLVIKD
ncbi:MAG: class I SAM-dependent methyltransferase, partial [Candidatus Thermoplasmatota archaeon]|nr:class I SAM-dependent methyltransferase [Candidatus Thermoplasmatota archaeon]